MEKEATIKEEQKDISINGLYDKLEEMKAKHGFLTESVVGLLERTDYCDGFKDNMIRGFELLMGSLENEFKEVETILDTLLNKQRLFLHAESGIIMTGQGCWATREVAIQHLNEYIDELKKFINYTNESNEKAEALLKKGKELLQRHQAA